MLLDTIRASRLPRVEEVKEEFIAAKISAHAGDLVKLGKGAARKDVKVSIKKALLDWKYQIEESCDPERAMNLKTQFPQDMEGCTSTMCGQYCVFLLLLKYLDERNIIIDELLERYKNRRSV